MDQSYIPLALWVLDFPLNLQLQEGQMDPVNTQMCSLSYMFCSLSYKFKQSNTHRKSRYTWMTVFSLSPISTWWTLKRQDLERLNTTHRFQHYHLKSVVRFFLNEGQRSQFSPLVQGNQEALTVQLLLFHLKIHPLHINATEMNRTYHIRKEQNGIEKNRLI